MKIKAIIKILENDGWYLSRTTGKLSDEIAIGTQMSIFKQAGFKK